MVEANSINASTFLMTDPTQEDERHTIFKLNKQTKRADKITNDEFDFRSHSTVQDGTELYSISFKNCAVHKHTNLSGGNAMVKTHIATLNKRRGFHTATLYNRQGIFIIGGNDGPRRYDSVHWLDLQTKRFTDAPSLNHARSGHSTAIHNGVIYVVGGFDGNIWLDTIESLNVQANETSWNIFTVPGFTARSYPLVCPLNENELLVAGGYDGTECKNDIFELCPTTKSADTLAAISPFGFECYNQATSTAHGEVFALVLGSDGYEHFIHFSSRTRKLSSVKSFTE